MAPKQINTAKKTANLPTPDTPPAFDEPPPFVAESLASSLLYSQ
jgi:hypothetical protein